MPFRRFFLVHSKVYSVYFPTTVKQTRFATLHVFDDRDVVLSGKLHNLILGCHTGKSATLFGTILVLWCLHLDTKAKETRNICSPWTHVLMDRKASTAPLHICCVC